MTNGHHMTNPALGWRGIGALMVVILAMVASMVLLPSSASAHPGHCKLEDWKAHLTTFTGAEQNYYMGSSVNKHNGACQDLNVRYVDHSAFFRGAYQTSSGTWRWSSVGRKWISNPLSQNIVVISNVVATTRVAAGSTDKDRAWDRRRSRWNH